MKKSILILILFFIFLMIIKNDEKKEEIRIRIISNSNLEEDLILKREIKNFTCVFLEEMINDEKNIENIKIKIKNNINNLSNELIKLYKENISVSFENHFFKNKTYNGKIIEGGNYLTLLIKINNAKGDNWWGTIYPELFSINTEEKITYKSYILEILKGDKNVKKSR